MILGGPQTKGSESKKARDVNLEINNDALFGISSTKTAEASINKNLTTLLICGVPRFGGKTTNNGFAKVYF